MTRSDPRASLRERLEKAVREYEASMALCRAERADADRENTAAGHASAFTAERCDECNRAAAVSALLREAADALSASSHSLRRVRAAQPEQV